MEEDPRNETQERMIRFRAAQSEMIKALAALDRVIEMTARELALEERLRFGEPETKR